MSNSNSPTNTYQNLNYIYGSLVSPYSRYSENSAATLISLGCKLNDVKVEPVYNPYYLTTSSATPAAYSQVDTRTVFEFSINEHALDLINHKVTKSFDVSNTLNEISQNPTLSQAWEEFSMTYAMVTGKQIPIK